MQIGALTEGMKRALGVVEEKDAAKDHILRGELVSHGREARQGLHGIAVEE